VPFVSFVSFVPFVPASTVAYFRATAGGQYNEVMPRFADFSVSAFLDALASPEPTPGGGTAAAAAGSIGAALLMMVAGLQKTRGNTDAERVRLNEARAALTSVRDRLLALADEDAKAYDRVVAAYRLPKASDQEKETRRRAIADGLRAATDAPLETLRAVAEAAPHAHVVAQYGNPAAASDVRVALELLAAAGAGAAANVEANLHGLNDDAYRKAAASRVVDESNQLTEHIATARAALGHGAYNA
jgi:formiminotetrahydrofolate cyclodeaminase